MHVFTKIEKIKSCYLKKKTSSPLGAGVTDKLGTGGLTTWGLVCIFTACGWTVCGFTTEFPADGAGTAGVTGKSDFAGAAGSTFIGALTTGAGLNSACFGAIGVAGFPV